MEGPTPQSPAACEQEPIYADPYTRIKWLHGEIDRLRGALTTISEMSDATPQASFREEAWAALDGAK